MISWIKKIKLIGCLVNDVAFKSYQEWLQKHGPFDAVIDAANIGLMEHKDFNFFKVGMLFHIQSYFCI